jgi:hypothetical protein
MSYEMRRISDEEFKARIALVSVSANRDREGLNAERHPADLGCKFCYPGTTFKKSSSRQSPDNGNVHKAIVKMVLSYHVVDMRCGK